MSSREMETQLEKQVLNVDMDIDQHTADSLTPHYGSQTPIHDGSRTPGQSGAWDPNNPNTPSRNDEEGFGYDDEPPPSPQTYGGTPIPQTQGIPCSRLRSCATSPGPQRTPAVTCLDWSGTSYTTICGMISNTQTLNAVLLAADTKVVYSRRNVRPAIYSLNEVKVHQVYRYHNICFAASGNVGTIHEVKLALITLLTQNALGGQVPVATVAGWARQELERVKTRQNRPPIPPIPHRPHKCCHFILGGMDPPVPGGLCVPFLYSIVQPYVGLRRDPMGVYAVTQINDSITGGSGSWHLRDVFATYNANPGSQTIIEARSLMLRAVKIGIRLDPLHSGGNVHLAEITDENRWPWWKVRINKFFPRTR